MPKDTVRWQTPYRNYSFCQYNKIKNFNPFGCKSVETPPTTSKFAMKVNTIGYTNEEGLVWQ